MSTPITDDMRQYFEPDGSPRLLPAGDAGAHYAPPPGSAPKSIRLFVANVRYTKDGFRHRLQCRKGRWLVEGNCPMQVWTEAWHYFEQYANDGEYGPNT